jgi:hypothetical protein
MFEQHHQPLSSKRKFLFRLARSIFLGLSLIVFAQFLGMLGYHYFEKMSWTDAFVNAAMILSGMGPLTPLNTSAGKLFAGFYALFSGLIFILIMGIIFAPVIHRFFHKFHLGSEGRK